MTLKHLKELILNNTPPTDFLVFVCKDNKFLARQYVTELARALNAEEVKITSIYEPLQSSAFLLTQQANDTLNVLTVETFDERAEDYTQFENTIVICDSIEKSLVSALDEYIVEMPKFAAWQLFDFVKTQVNFLEDYEINWLLEGANNDIYRIINELDKVKLFSPEEQRQVFQDIRFEPNSDLFKIDFYTFVNALVVGDCEVIKNYLAHGAASKLDPIGVANQVTNSLKNILLATQNPTATAADLGMSSKQHRALNSIYKTVWVEAVKSKLKFLTRLDVRLKSSELDMSKEDMLTYIVANLAYRIK
jgi:DNA polymerase III delta subunit